MQNNIGTKARPSVESDSGATTRRIDAAACLKQACPLLPQMAMIAGRVVSTCTRKLHVSLKLGSNHSYSCTNNSFRHTSN